jgi:hypothetical protein
MPIQLELNYLKSRVNGLLRPFLARALARRRPHAVRRGYAKALPAQSARARHRASRDQQALVR